MKSRLISILAVLLTAFSLNAAERMNVVMIVVDDLNDYVGVMGGHPQAKTPHMDALANSGVIFTNAHSNSPVCLSSRASFLTGVSPATAQNYGFKNWTKNPILHQSKTLSEYCRDNGYQVMKTGKIEHVTRQGAWDEIGSHQGQGPLAYDGQKTVQHPSNPAGMASMGALDATFARLSDVPTVNGYKGWWDPGSKKPFRYVSENDRDLMTDELSARWFVNKIKELDASGSDKPFFIGVGFVNPHTPLVAPDKYFDRFPMDSLQLPGRLANDAADTMLKKSALKDDPGRGATQYSMVQEGYPGEDEGIKRYLQAYLACMAMTDDMVGEVVAAIDNSRFADSTIILLFSDHGYHVGEKDMLWKYTLWDQGTRVPLFVRDPRFKNNAGKRVNHPVSLLDVFPTIQDLCQLKGDTRKGSEGVAPEGYSLRPFLGNPEGAVWDGPKVAISMTDSYIRQKPEEQHNGVRSERYRYIHYRNGMEELYDLLKDPNEFTNLAGDPAFADIKAKHKQKLLDQFAAYAAKLTEAAPAAAAASTEKTDAEKWKDAYFQKHPEADADGDGELTWPEYHAHKKGSKA